MSRFRIDGPDMDANGKPCAQCGVEIRKGGVTIVDTVGDEDSKGPICSDYCTDEALAELERRASRAVSAC